MALQGRRQFTIAAAAVSLATTAWLAREYLRRDPHDFELDRDFRQWQDDDGLARAMSALTPQERGVLRLWMSRYATGTDGASLRARTIGEAIEEIQRLAHKDARLRTAVELYTAPRTLAGTSPGLKRLRATP